MLDFTAVIRAWLNADPADRDLAQGALLLMQLSRNTIRYQSQMRNLPAHAAAIESELREYLRIRQQRAEVRQTAQEIIQATDEVKISRGGRRPDHDSLPPEIQNLYVENLELRHRMQKYNLEIRTLLASEAGCAADDLKDIVALLKATDEKYHDNWAKYDAYGISDK